MYIELAGSHTHDEGTVPNKMMTSLLEARHPVDTKMKHAEISLFKVSDYLTNLYAIHRFMANICRTLYQYCQKMLTAGMLNWPWYLQGMSMSHG